MWLEGVSATVKNHPLVSYKHTYQRTQQPECQRQNLCVERLLLSRPPTSVNAVLPTDTLIHSTHADTMKSVALWISPQDAVMIGELVARHYMPHEAGFGDIWE